MVVSHSEFLALVRNRIDVIIGRVERSYGRSIHNELLQPEKMLRTIFASRLIEQGVTSSGQDSLACACAAAELVHAASLCHGDIAGNGCKREGSPGLKATKTLSGAVLVGDMFLNESIMLLLTHFDRQYVTHFIDKVKDVFMAGIKKEITLQQQGLAESARMSIAGGTSGPFFGFVGHVCGGSETRLSEALEDVGYMIGDAFQLYDTVFGTNGDDILTGQSINSCLNHEDLTFLTFYRNDMSVIKMKVSQLCADALKCLRRWPHAKRAVEIFFECDLQPALNRSHEGLKILHAMK